LGKWCKSSGWGRAGGRYPGYGGPAAGDRMVEPWLNRTHGSSKGAQKAFHQKKAGHKGPAKSNREVKKRAVAAIPHLRK